MKLSIKIQDNIALLGTVIYQNQPITHSSCSLYYEVDSIEILDKIITKLFEILPNQIDWYWDHFHEVLHLNFLDKHGVIDYLEKKFINKNFTFIDNNIGSKSHPRLKKINYKSNPYFLGLTHVNKFDISPRIFGKHFTCLNLHPKEHRTKIYQFLYENNLIEKTYFSYVAYDKLHPYFHQLKTEENLNLEKPQNKPTADKIEYKPLVEHKNSFCSIINDTYFYDYQMDEYVRDAIFVTEKIEKCFSAGQPFILVGRPYTLQKLKELGYQTFSDFWDESYDRIEDDEQRLENVKDLISNISTMKLSELEKIYQKLIPILIHNQKINEKWYTLNKKKCSTQFINHECNVHEIPFEI